MFHSLGAQVKNAVLSYDLVFEFCCKRSSKEFERILIIHKVSLKYWIKYLNVKSVIIDKNINR